MLVLAVALQQGVGLAPWQLAWPRLVALPAPSWAWVDQPLPL